MSIEKVNSLDDPRLEDYRRVREPALLSRRGVFIAESREVVRLLLETRRFRVRSLLVTPTALAALGPGDGRTRVLVAERELLERVVGYNVHRGCLAAGERGRELALEELLPPPGQGGTLLLLDGVSDPDNVGVLFRNALAFGARGVVVGPGCADPLYRKAIRVSMAGSLRLPFVRVPAWPAALARLRAAGLVTVALTPASDAMELRELEPPPARAALLLGNEGQGLGRELCAAADLRVRIGMAPGVDSINVAAAAAVALYHVGRGRRPGS